PAPTNEPATIQDTGHMPGDESLQRIAEAHLTFQRMLTETHQQFLELTERTLAARPPYAVPPPRPEPTVLAPPPQAAPINEPEQLAPAPALEEASSFPSAPASASGIGPWRPGLAVTEPERPGTAPPRPGRDGVRTFVLSVIEDKTGYPADMLRDEQQLDVDLGIDSIKRVEILSSLQDVVPSLNELDADTLTELASLRTIGDVIAKAEDLLGGPSPAVAAGGGGSEPGSADPPVLRQVMRVEPAPPTGLGVVRPRTEGRMVVTDDGAGLAPLVVEGLAAHAVHAEVVDTVPADATGAILLGGFREPLSVDDALGVQRAAFQAARTLAPRLGDGGVFVTVQGTGGDFGTTAAAGPATWAGGLSALARTVASEHPSAGVKAIDCAVNDRQRAATAIVHEITAGGPALSVGLRPDGERVVLRYDQAEIDSADDTVSAERIHDVLGDAPVIVASGGARGVTATALHRLAAAAHVKLILLGRTVLEDEPPGLSEAATEHALIKTLGDQARSREDGKPDLIELRAEAQRILAVREVRRSLAAFGRTGADVRYLTADVRDLDAVSAALAGVRRDWGPITGLVHGAGVLADERIAGKSDARFDRVFDTKVCGLRSLLAATATDPLRLICAFSSVSAHLGTPGQCDYAMANETVEVVLAAERSRRTSCAVRTIAWGPWEAGMVTERIAERFRAAGYALIPPPAGADAFLSEITRGSGARVVRTMPPMTRPPRTIARLHVHEAGHPQFADHCVADVPLVPMAQALEWFLAAAQDLLAGDARTCLRDLKVYRGIKLPSFDGDGHHLVLCGADTGRASGGDLELTLHGEDPRRPYYRVTAAISDRESAPAGQCEPPTEPGTSWPGERLYSEGLLFPGPAFQAITALAGLSDGGAQGTVIGAHRLGWANGRRWRSDTGAVDGALQIAGLWAGRILGGACLPMGFDECRVRRPGLIAGPATCLVYAGETGAAHARCDVVLLDGDDNAPRIELDGVHMVRHPS
ncbi:SDR family NAD(P)-dependent oxidoreductase, partial [Actinomadura rubrisoli]